MFTLLTKVIKLLKPYIDLLNYESVMSLWRIYIFDFYAATNLKIINVAPSNPLILYYYKLLVFFYCRPIKFTAITTEGQRPADLQYSSAVQIKYRRLQPLNRQSNRKRNSVGKFYILIIDVGKSKWVIAELHKKWNLSKTRNYLLYYFFQMII